MDKSFKKYKKIGIMGGSFDPIHNGHLHVSQLAIEKLNLDIVLFVPTGITPHKNNEFSASKYDRFNMASLAISDNDKFLISDIEINNIEVCYTVDTLSKIKKIIRRDAELFFITGFDTIELLETWKQPEKLGELCTFVAVSRPNYPEKEILSKIKKISKKLNLDIIPITGLGLNISSTYIKNAILNNISVKYLVPNKIICYINKNGLYMDYYSDELIEKMKTDVKNVISPKRYEHVNGVALTAKKLAYVYGASERLAYIAGILHDYAKEMSKKEKKSYCDENNIYMDDIIEDNIDLIHGVIGANIARDLYNIKNDDLFNSIKYHTTGRENMSLLEKIIILADMIEPSRSGKDVEKLREIAYINIDKAIIKALEIKISYTKKRKLPVHPLSLTALNYMEENGRENNWKK